jgi:phospholipid/cholesterol/gamma-HCH transport system ATP-binding protein
MMETEIIKIENLHATFGDNHILKDVSFRAYKNQITVILGKSGSGKSVMLKHLLGLYPIHQGSVSIDGHMIEKSDEEEMRQLRLQSGVLFQNGALINSLTVGENIAIPLEQHTRLQPDLIKILIAIKLKLVGLENASELLPSQLSGGMRKRAALARAIALDPPFLFCDEPSAGLDPVTLEALDILILKLKIQLGMTIILVTHEVSSIFRLADRVIFLEDGHITYEGDLPTALASTNTSVSEFFNKAKGKGINYRQVKP